MVVFTHIFGVDASIFMFRGERFENISPGALDFEMEK